MGMNAEIYFEMLVDGDFEDILPGCFEVNEIEDWIKEDHPGATHELELTGYNRYYGDGYEGGHWPTICAALMILHASEGVGRVWYGGDSDCVMPEVKPEDIAETSLHYMEHGHRPYRR